MASSWNIPIISPAGSSERVTNKTEFSTLTNLAFTMENFAEFYMDLFRNYQWRDIAMVFEENHTLMELLAKSLNNVFERNNFSTTPFPFHSKNFAAILKEASMHSRGMSLNSSK